MCHIQRPEMQRRQQTRGIDQLCKVLCSSLQIGKMPCPRDLCRIRHSGTGQEARESGRSSKGIGCHLPEERSRLDIMTAITGIQREHLPHGIVGGQRRRRFGPE